jgi:hypothetical protein
MILVGCGGAFRGAGPDQIIAPAPGLSGSGPYRHRQVVRPTDRLPN